MCCGIYHLSIIQMHMCVTNFIPAISCMWLSITFVMRRIQKNATLFLFSLLIFCFQFFFSRSKHNLRCPSKWSVLYCCFFKFFFFNECMFVSLMAVVIHIFVTFNLITYKSIISSFAAPCSKEQSAFRVFMFSTLSFVFLFYLINSSTLLVFFSGFSKILFLSRLETNQNSLSSMNIKTIITLDSFFFLLLNRN